LTVARFPNFEAVSRPSYRAIVTRWERRKSMKQHPLWLRGLPMDPGSINADHSYRSAHVNRLRPGPCITIRKYFTRCRLTMVTTGRCARVHVEHNGSFPLDKHARSARRTVVNQWLAPEAEIRHSHVLSARFQLASASFTIEDAAELRLKGKITISGVWNRAHQLSRGGASYLHSGFAEERPYRMRPDRIVVE
jgi:hypothetical protein